MAAKSGSRKRKVGAPSITPTQRKEMLEAIRLGLPKDRAARLVGIPRRTFFDWIQKGSAPDAPAGYRKFVDEVDLALIQFEHRQLVYIDKASADYWQAAMTNLERKFPDRYGKRTRIDSNVTVTATPMWDTGKLTLEEKQELARLIRKCSPEPEQLEQGQAPVLELLRGGEFIEGEIVEEQ